MKTIKCFPLEGYTVDIGRFQAPIISVSMMSMDKEKGIEFAEEVKNIMEAGCNYKITIEALD